MKMSTDQSQTQPVQEAFADEKKAKLRLKQKRAITKIVLLDGVTHWVNQKNLTVVKNIVSQVPRHPSFRLYDAINALTKTQQFSTLLKSIPGQSAADRQRAAKQGFASLTLGQMFKLRTANEAVSTTGRNLIVVVGSYSTTDLKFLDTIVPNLKRLAVAANLQIELLDSASIDGPDAIKAFLPEVSEFTFTPFVCLYTDGRLQETAEGERNVTALIERLSSTSQPSTP
jgi:hypothetical protein